MRRFFPAAPVCILALFVLFSAAPSAAFEASYVSSQQLNLSKLLAPPPAPESNMQKADLSAVLSAQESRTEQQADRAVQDNNTSLFRIADGLFGDQFTLLDEAGIDPNAKWLVAEGADAQFLDRSVPVKKAYDDALVAIYQNGEHLMPGNGYPMRLLLPGYQGNMNVK